MVFVLASIQAATVPEDGWISYKMFVYFISCYTLCRQCGVGERDMERQTEVKIQLCLLLDVDCGQIT